MCVIFNILIIRMNGRVVRQDVYIVNILVKILYYTVEA